MVPAVGQTVTVIGPDQRSQHGRVVSTYCSTGGFLSVWIDLDDCFANPANRGAADWTTRVLVLTERDGIYRDLWQGRWKLEAVEI